MVGGFNPAGTVQNTNQKYNPGNVLGGAGQAIDAAGANGALDPGEMVTVSFGVQNVCNLGGTCTTANLLGVLQADGGVMNPSGPQNYGMLCSAGGAAYRPYTFAVDPALPCGSTVTASLVLTDGTRSYETLTYTFITGSKDSAFLENFDTVTPPALPGRAGGHSLWQRCPGQNGAGLWFCGCGAERDLPSRK